MPMTWLVTCPAIVLLCYGRFAVSESNASWVIYWKVNTKTSWLVKNFKNNGNLTNDVTLFSFWGTNNEITHNASDSETANYELCFLFLLMYFVYIAFTVSLIKHSFVFIVIKIILQCWLLYQVFTFYLLFLFVLLTYCCQYIGIQCNCYTSERYS